MTARPNVTLFIPTRNAGIEFRENFRHFQSQRVDGGFEILIVDSGSTDGTVEFLRQQPVRLIEVSSAEFNHGLTRRRAIEESRAEIVVLTVQDACPADELWMRWLVDAFSDERVAGAYSHQIARSDASPFVRDRIRGGELSDPERRVQAIESFQLWEQLPPQEKARLATFDNVGAAVRRRVMLDLPFSSLRFGEDLEWAQRALLAGFKIVFEPRSRVIHSHNRSPWYEMKRVYVDHQTRYRLFGLQVVPRRRDLITRTIQSARHATKVLARDSSIGLFSRLAWGARVIPYSFGQSFAQYLGARSAIVGTKQRGSFFAWVDRWLGGGV